MVVTPNMMVQKAVLTKVAPQNDPQNDPQNKVPVRFSSGTGGKIR